MMRRLIVALVLLVASTAAADRKSALENAEPIRNRIEVRAGRHRVAPVFGFSINDAYKRSLSVGLDYRYYFNNWFGLGVDIMGTYLNLDTGLTEQIDTELTTPGKSAKPSTSNPSMLATVGISLVPLYGKMMLFDTFPMAYDLHLVIGAGIALTNGEGRIDNGLSFAPMWSAGMRFFFSDWIALELGVRDYFIDMTEVAPSDVKNPDTSFKQNFMVTIGVSFFFPPEIETQL